MDHADLTDQHQRHLTPVALMHHAAHRVQQFLTHPAAQPVTLLRLLDQKVQAAVLTVHARHAGQLARQLLHTDLMVRMVHTELMSPAIHAVQSVTKTCLTKAGCGLKSRVAAGKIPVAASL